MCPKKPGFEPGTRHLVRVPLYPIELLGRCKGTYLFRNEKKIVEFNILAMGCEVNRWD